MGIRIRAQKMLSAVVVLVALVASCAFTATPALAAEGEGCPNEQVREESNVNPTTGKPYSVGLPECRAYEMVSPLYKEGHDVEMGQGVLESPTTAAGNAIGYISLGEFAGAEGGNGSLRSNPYTSYRTASGWTARSEYIPAPIGAFALSIASETGTVYSSDLSSLVQCAEPGEGSRITEPAVVCGLHQPDGAWLASPVFPKVLASLSVGNIQKYAASTDLSHVFFTMHEGETLLASDTQRTAREPSGSRNSSGIYELAGLGTGGPVTLRLVNLDNSGVELGTGVASLGNAVGGAQYDGTDYHAVSEDGETVYFEGSPAGSTVQTLYARLHAASTVAISEPSVVDCAECQTAVALQKEALFQGASGDGSKVFFTTEQELFAGHTTNNLYEFDFNAPAGHRLSLVTGTVAKGEVQGVLRNSGDGSHIYFVAQSVLTAAPNAQDQEAQSGADNLYMYERDNTYPAGRTTFITALCSAQNQSGSTADTKCPNPASDDSGLWATGDTPGNHHEGMPRNGDYIAFETYAHLLPEDQNEAPGIYLFDALTGELTWVSHAAPGFTAGNEKDPSSIPGLRGNVAGSLPDVENDGRIVSEDGSDVVFSTAEKLQADDVNNLNDVYLWHDGTVSLISGGQDASGVGADAGLGTLLGSPNMSADGSNIFFTVRTQLVGQDVDGNADVYDARVDGGFPAPAPSVECAQKESGEACQGPLAAPPSFATAATATFTGGANLVPPVEVKPSITSPAPKPAVLTRAQKLAQALKACKKDKAQKKRVACEARARKKYGAKVKSKSKGKAKVKPKGNGKAKSNAKTETSNRRGI